MFFLVFPFFSCFVLSFSFHHLTAASFKNNLKKSRKFCILKNDLNVFFLYQEDIFFVSRSQMRGVF